jgi:hypothetical protein
VDISTGGGNVGRIERSMALARASWDVLKSDRELLLFPVLSGIASVTVVLTFLVPVLVFGVFSGGVEGGTVSWGPIPMVGTFLFYLVQYTVIFFFNSALVGAATIRLEGGDPTVSDGLRIAFDRIGAIVEYAALAATVGMFLRFIQERVGFVGKLFAGLAGVGWTMATFLAVPVLVHQRLGPIDVVRESAGLFRKTWGEQMVGQGGIGLLTGLLAFGTGAVGVGLTIAAGTLGMPPVVVMGMVGLTVTSLMGVGIVGAALKGVYSAALYRYATTGAAGPGFSRELMRGAFQPKR